MGFEQNFGADNAWETPEANTVRSNFENAQKRRLSASWNNISAEVSRVTEGLGRLDGNQEIGKVNLFDFKNGLLRAVNLCQKEIESGTGNMNKTEKVIPEYAELAEMLGGLRAGFAQLKDDLVGNKGFTNVASLKDRYNDQMSKFEAASLLVKNITEKDLAQAS